MLFLSLQTTTRLTLSQALLACRQQPRSGAIPVRFLTLSLPTLQLTATDTSLNTTALVSPDVYETQYKVLYAVQTEAISENKYGYGSTGQERRREHAGSRLSDSIAILVVGFGLPTSYSVISAIYLASQQHILGCDRVLFGLALPGIRVLRIIVSGPQYATVTDLGNRYMRNDVPGLR